MLIPVTVSPASESNPKLPPGLAKISHDEIALIELQGLLEVEASRPEERDGKFVGKLNMDNPVSPSTLLFWGVFLFFLLYFQKGAHGPVEIMSDSGGHSKGPDAMERLRHVTALHCLAHAHYASVSVSGS